MTAFLPTVPDIFRITENHSWFEESEDYFLVFLDILVELDEFDHSRNEYFWVGGFPGAAVLGSDEMLLFTWIDFFGILPFLPGDASLDADRMALTFTYWVGGKVEISDFMDVGEFWLEIAFMYRKVSLEVPIVTLLQPDPRSTIEMSAVAPWDNLFVEFFSSMDFQRFVIMANGGGGHDIGTQMHQGGAGLATVPTSHIITVQDFENMSIDHLWRLDVYVLATNNMWSDSSPFVPILPGIQWDIRQSAADNMWVSVCYGNGLYVAVAMTGVGNRVMTSPDGINWTSRGGAGDLTWSSVCYGNGMFVAVADSGTGGRVMTSPDGISWTRRASASDTHGWTGVCFGGGQFVAVSHSGIGTRVMTSPNGINWTLRASAGDFVWVSVCYGNGLYVAVAATNISTSHIMTSPNGINWTMRQSPLDRQLRSVCYGNNMFVAVASTGVGNRVMTSPDGITWTGRQNTADLFFRSVCFGAGLFVVVAATTTGHVMTSPDGISWTQRENAAPNSWQSVCYGNGRFVAVATSGTGNRVMTSG